MTLLANRIASQRSLELLTPSLPLCDFAAGFSAETYHQPYSLAHSRNEALGRSMLTKIVIDGITIDPLVSDQFSILHSSELTATFSRPYFLKIMCSSEGCKKLWFLYKLEGEPKGVAIEQLTFPLAVELNLLHPAGRTLSGVQQMERNGLCRLRLSVVMKILSQRTSLTRRKSAHPQKEHRSGM